MNPTENVTETEYENAKVAATDSHCGPKECRRFLEQAIGVPFTAGNAIQALRNGVEIFPAMLEAIERSERSILFETYVYWTGDIAERFSDLLANKATEGLTVRVLLDAHGASAMKKTYIRKMRDAGVKVAWFRPLRWRLWDYDKRTHRKVLVCDNKVGFTGGVGIAQEWEGDARNENEWRETHFRIEGPAVAGLSGAFWNNWIDIEGETLPLENEMGKPMPVSPGNARIMVARSSPATHQSEMELVFEALLAAAKKRVMVTTPYFNIRQKTIDLILAKAKEGVVFDFLLPGTKIDKKFELPLADECLSKLVRHPNISFFRFQPSMIHAKVIRIDDTISCVGSPNFNQRSRKKDFEIALVVDDFHLAERLDQDFQMDLSRSKRISPESVKDPTLPRRLIGKALTPFREQL